MGLEYDPKFATAFAPIAEKLKNEPKPAVGDVQARRERSKRLLSQLGSKQLEWPDVERTDHIAQGKDGADIQIAEYRNKTATRPSKAVFYIHGGGMIRGSVDDFDPVTRMRCSRTGFSFFAVQYRLAPEHPFPTSVEDCYTALEWLYDHASNLSILCDRIGIMGESAGGGLAAVALMARDQGLSPPLAKQILIFPMLDDRNLTPIPEIDELATWNCDDNITGWRALLGDLAGNSEGVSEYAAPARAADLRGLPPTYIECGQLDIFCFEDMRYAMRLLEARVPTELHIYPGQPHGFMLFAPESRYSQMAMSNVLAAIKEV